ncbi:GNAT family N-acetyltransferase [Roseinatronobacter sp. NSM]|uniref:GNAT family N-acetyltransferase n=1 Tax=Roseinatronobacter sp. NSM TaxID=3457785 RepID=UPI004035FB49
MRVTMQDQKKLIAWAEPRMGVETGRAPPETLALGVLDDAGKIRAVVWLNAFYATHASAHIASDRSRAWSTAKVWRVIFAFAFDHLQKTRLTLIIPEWNIKAITLAMKLGFKVEGVARCGANDGSDGIVLGMLSHECRWLPKQIKE